ncbi:MAG: SDR family NAD(P)-dependent oxidoreductase [Rhizobiales bacterium]|nr:SDR family NAD(P)-dependent oxidoreductase [Hyphomicrobiales bacterium]
MPKTVVITGASSGLGEALAVRYARAGTVLGMVGRDRQRLERVAERCRASGCEVRLAFIDVRDRPSLAAWLNELDRASPVDLVIANAGVLTGTSDGQLVEDPDAAFKLMEINVLGVMNTVQPLLPRMLARGRGQIAIMSSVAGLVALPDSPAYSASKSAILRYGLALRGRVRAAGVRVNVLCPGYITTPMAARIKGWRPLEMSVEAAVDRIVKALDRDRELIAFPWALVFISRFAMLLPDGLRRVAMKPFKFHVAPSSEAPTGRAAESPTPPVT